jgi:hypothetical protein
VAVAHSILKIVYHLLKHGCPYRDLGGSYFDRLDPERLTRYLVRRLERLGLKVTLEPVPTAWRFNNTYRAAEWNDQEFFKAAGADDSGKAERLAGSSDNGDHSSDGSKSGCEPSIVKAPLRQSVYRVAIKSGSGVE